MARCWLHTLARRLAKEMRHSRAARQRREEMALSDSAVTGTPKDKGRYFQITVPDAVPASSTASRYLRQRVSR